MKKYTYVLLLLSTLSPAFVLSQAAPYNGEVTRVKKCVAIAQGPDQPVDEKTIHKWTLITFRDKASNSDQRFFQDKAAAQQLGFGDQFIDGPKGKSDIVKETKQFCCGHLKMGQGGKFLCGGLDSNNFYSDNFGGLTGQKGRGHKTE